MSDKKIDPTVERAIAAAGGLRPLARKLGISHNTVSQWKQVPVKYLFKVEAITGISREELRPDIFQQPRFERPNVAE